jgi:hypothetical protein
MKEIYFPLLMSTLILVGCSSAPPIQKASATKSYFDGAVYPGDVYKLTEDNSGAEQYRVFSHGSSGFVSLASVQSNAEGRAKEFCGREGKITKVLQQQTSTPPHVLGNFPRAELIFICVEKSAAFNQPSKANEASISPSVNTTPISMEQAKSKCQDLGFKAGTESFGQCVLKISK